MNNKENFRKWLINNHGIQEESNCRNTIVEEFSVEYANHLGVDSFVNLAKWIIENKRSILIHADISMKSALFVVQFHRLLFDLISSEKY